MSTPAVTGKRITSTNDIEIFFSSTLIPGMQSFDYITNDKTIAVHRNRNRISPSNNCKPSHYISTADSIQDRYNSSINSLKNKPSSSSTSTWKGSNVGNIKQSNKISKKQNEPNVTKSDQKSLDTDSTNVKSK